MLDASTHGMIQYVFLLEARQRLITGAPQALHYIALAHRGSMLDIGIIILEDIHGTMISRRSSDGRF